MTDRQWILLAHLGTLLGYSIVLGNFLVPLFIWLSKKEEAPEVGDHAKESLNFQLSLTLYLLLSIPLIFVGIGVALIIVIVLLNVVLVIQAALEADKGRLFRYPLNLRLIK